MTSHDFFDVAPEVVAAGYVAVASDYEGLGTPGVHPFLLGASQGRGQLDIVKAAQQMEEVAASDKVVLWGRSQGGHSSLFAGEIAPSWAPQLEVLGVISAAPASEFPTALRVVPARPHAAGFVWQLSIGYGEMYEELSIEDVYTEQALASIGRLIDEEACGREFSEAAKQVEHAGFKTNPVDIPAWFKRLEENSPGRVTTESPILLLQGSEDSVVPKALTDTLHSTLCRVGAQVDYRVFDGFSHNDSTLLNMPRMLEWTRARFAGEPAETTCPRH